MTHATIEVCLFLEKITFWMTGLLNTPQTRQIIIFFFFVRDFFFRRVPTRPWDCSSGM